MSFVVDEGFDRDRLRPILERGYREQRYPLKDEYVEEAVQFSLESAVMVVLLDERDEIVGLLDAEVFTALELPDSEEIAFQSASFGQVLVVHDHVDTRRKLQRLLIYKLSQIATGNELRVAIATGEHDFAGLITTVQKHEDLRDGINSSSVDKARLVGVDDGVRFAYYPLDRSNVRAVEDVEGYRVVVSWPSDLSRVEKVYNVDS
jgi:hypothetical protein